MNKDKEEIEDIVEPDMDYEQDFDYIKASFMSDYQIDLEKTDMHWWSFVNLMNGLSNSELGNCCILNKIRNLRNFDVSEIKDAKEREKILKAKQSVALKKERKITAEEQANAEQFYRLMGIKE